MHKASEGPGGGRDTEKDKMQCIFQKSWLPSRRNSTNHTQFAMGPNLETKVTDHLFPPIFLEVSHRLRNQKTPGLTSS